MGLWFSQPLVPMVNLKIQTREISGGARISNYLKTDELLALRYDDVRTVFEAVRRGARVSNNSQMLGYRKKQDDGSEPFFWIKYDEVIDRSVTVARALRKLGFVIGQETFIGIYALNSPEWVIIEHATYAFNNILVPLYETLGVEACCFILEQTAIEIVFCDSLKKIDRLLQKHNKSHNLKHIVLIGNEVVSPKKLAEAESLGIKVYSFEQIEEMGKSPDVLNLELVPPKPEDLCTICYTSGTTGLPKGVMLTHANVIADCTTLNYFPYTKIGQNDVMMSFLPLAHMFERVLHAAIYMEGGSVGFFRGNIKLLADDIKTLRPTILPAVPRVLNRIYDKVFNELNKSQVSKFIFNLAIAYKSYERRNFVIRNNSLVDQIVFKKIREGMGGRIKLIVTGSAPISEQVMTFIRCALGCVVVEGYGQTECVAACTITTEGDFEAGHVGIPIPCNEIKLIDIPEMSYFSKDMVGEVCVRGENVFKGYYKMPELTKEALDSDGWLHTGDIGRWRTNGTLKIVDRKKHIFKLAQGEYLVPEKIENIYTLSKYVAQCFVYGESLKMCIIAIVVPDPEVLPVAVATELGIQNKNVKELCENPAVKNLIFNDMISIGKSNGLASFEQVKDVYLHPELFSIENDLLTPTLKSKRRNLKKYFMAQLNEMYEKLN